MVANPSYQSIVVLTGAGISAESGIETFRASDGLWESHRIEDVASPEGFINNPALVQRFYNARRQQLLSASINENAAHVALARLEANHSGSFLLVTQNIDDLHERAGSEALIHMHGELLKNRCTSCGTVAPCVEDISVEDLCSTCQARGTLRPHIVWFGEMPFQMERIQRALLQCDLFISIGTSGNVYPAAGFAQQAAQAGAYTLQLNLEASNTPGQFDRSLFGPATELVPAVVDQLLTTGHLADT